MAIINGVGKVGVRITQTVFPTQFISTWKTDNAGVTASNQIRIPTDGGYSYNCTVDWGDGTTSTYNGYGPTMTHTYGIAGTYTVKISGTFPSIRFAGGGDRLKILEITNWGNIQWKFLHSSFQDCTNLKITAQDTPDFSQITTFQSTFLGAGITSFSFKNLNLSSCGSFYGMFQGANKLTSVNFTGAILNTSSNVSMERMFYGTGDPTKTLTLTGFNTLNTSKVTTMALFGQSSRISSIDLSNMNFSSCVNFGSAFNSSQLASINLTNMILSTTSGVNMAHMFGNSLLTTLTGFKTLNTSKVTSMNQTFTGGLKMTGTLDFSGMDFSSCIDFSYCFRGGSFTEINVSNWVLNTTSNFSMYMMFYQSSNLTTITGFNTLNTSKVTDMGSFASATKLGSIDMSGMNFSSCVNFGNTFSYAQLTNVNVTNMILSTTSGVNMAHMFSNSLLTTLTGFKTLNTSKVTSMYQTFIGGLKMTGTLDFSGMDFSSCTNFGYMFNGGLISSINVSNWVLNTTSNFSMMWMFYNCNSLTNLTGISTWNISKVSDMSQFVNSATLNTTEYSNALIYWSTLNLNSNINFKYGSTKYNSSASSARASIITNKTWTISDGGLAA